MPPETACSDPTPLQAREAEALILNAKIDAEGSAMAVFSEGPLRVTEYTQVSGDAVPSTSEILTGININSPVLDTSMLNDDSP